MRKLFTAILALAGAASLLIPVRYASADIEQAIMPDARDVTRAARLRTAADPADPDTVWIGHIWDQTFTAGGTMSAGGFGPYRVGRGPNLPTRSGGTLGDNGTWDFDRFQGPFAPGGAEKNCFAYRFWAAWMSPVRRGSLWARCLRGSPAGPS